MPSHQFILHIYFTINFSCSKQKLIILLFLSLQEYTSVDETIFKLFKMHCNA